MVSTHTKTRRRYSTKGRRYFLLAFFPKDALKTKEKRARKKNLAILSCRTLLLSYLPLVDAMALMLPGADVVSRNPVALAKASSGEITSTSRRRVRCKWLFGGDDDSDARCWWRWRWGFKMPQMAGALVKAPEAIAADAAELLLAASPFISRLARRRLRCRCRRRSLRSELDSFGEDAFFARFSPLHGFDSDDIDMSDDSELIGDDDDDDDEEEDDSDAAVAADGLRITGALPRWCMAELAARE